ncbi:DUF4260 domain-containing protein [Chryseolinea sp. T2]|uniref:DUF4260 domain-containing protein n=1 Tax=Chryseolinea sp. T2 TaxID=3129255 RepID=UPI0030780C10
MKYVLRIEEAIQFLATVYLNYQLPVPGWWYWAFFLAPDLSFLGYTVNPKVGAVAYNLAHHKGIAVTCWLAGLYLNVMELQFAGLVLYGHSSFDRLCGYGLKYADDFKHTHLGWIGKK